MKLRFIAGIIAVLGLSSPAAADGLSPWGVWSDGAQIKKSKQQPSPFALNSGPQKLGLNGLLQGPLDPAAAAKAALQLGKPKTPPTPVELAAGGARPSIAPKAPGMVALNAGYAPGSVIIDTSGRKLYYMVSSSQALNYPIAVGKAGFTWTGAEKVSKIVDWPDWTPPVEMRERKPNLPLKMTGGVNNPLGAKAIYLGSTLYRIHGTNDGDSIGTAASSGCFRMHNSHVVHLATLVNAGTPVYVLKSLPKGSKSQNI